MQQVNLINHFELPNIIEICEGNFKIHIMREIITLSNGKRVANFSSPHPFTFEDGSVLPAVDDKNAERLNLTFLEKSFSNGDIELEFDLSADVQVEIDYWMNKYWKEEVNVVFCPLPMINVLKEYCSFHTTCDDIRNTPFRAIRMTDRINKLVSINKQCV